LPASGGIFRRPGVILAAPNYRSTEDFARIKALGVGGAAACRSASSVDLSGYFPTSGGLRGVLVTHEAPGVHPLAGLVMRLILCSDGHPAREDRQCTSSHAECAWGGELLFQIKPIMLSPCTMVRNVNNQIVVSAALAHAALA
jgi:hypothetical protein